MRYEMRAKLWLYSGPAAWHFITLPKKVSQSIKRLGPRSSSFGSVRVKATIGRTGWKTSIFPDSKARAFLLPVKAAVRKKEKIAAGDTVRLAVELTF